MSNKIVLVKDLLQKRIDDLKSQKSTLESFKYLPGNANDTFKSKNATYWKIEKSLSASQTELGNLSYGNADTSIKYFAQYIVVNRDSLNAAIDSLSNNKEIQNLRIKVLLRDTCTLLSDASAPYQKQLQLTYSTNKPDNLYNQLFYFRFLDLFFHSPNDFVVFVNSPDNRCC